MTPRPPHIRDRMVRKIAQQIAALPDGGAWQLDERLAGLLGWSIRDSTRAIDCELARLRRYAGVSVRLAFRETVMDNREPRPIAVFHKPHRRSVTGHVLG